MPAEISRRRALGLLGGALLAGGCAGQPETRIAIPWSGLERERFLEVIAPYQKQQSVTVYSAGDVIGALLDNPVAAAATPDVAIVPRPSLISAACDRIKPLPGGAPDDSAKGAWSNLLTCGQEPKGVWFKVAHKSLVWCREGDGDRFALSRTGPARWDEWITAVREAARSGPVLSIGAADGWVLTDWFENVLLGHAPQVYERLLSSGRNRDEAAWEDPAVADALERLRELWTIPHVLPDGGARALDTTFHDSILDAFRYDSAAMVSMGDYALPLIAAYGKHTGQPFRFPTDKGEKDDQGRAVDPPPVMVGGDAAVALTTRGTEFITWLREAEATNAVSAWAGKGGLISLNPAVASHALLPDIPQIRAGEIAFDLSDYIVGGLSGDSGRGLSRILTRFFKEVTGVERPQRDPVETAWRAIKQAAGQG